MIAPTLASVAFYDVVVWAHVTAAVIAFGPTYVFGVYFSTAESRDPRSIPTIVRATGRVTDTFTMGGSVLVLATGIYLTIDRWSFGDLFVTVGMTVVIALMVLHFAFFRPRSQALIETAERDLGADGTGELSDEYHSISKSLAIVGGSTGLAIVLVIYFMVTKPFM